MRILRQRVCGIAVTRFIERMLFGVTPYDLTTFAVAGLLVVIVALLTSYLPARLAAKMDVGVCLRWE
jgi:ABC-type antimicrobial peptide transport system permease subunit